MKSNNILPQYRVVLRNDEVNSLEKVITALIILGNKPIDEAVRLASEISLMGSGVITSAHYELAETIATKLNNIGLSAYIEKDLI